MDSVDNSPPAQAAGVLFVAPAAIATGFSAIDIREHASHPGCSLTPAFRNVVDTASAAMVVVDSIGNFIFANPAAEALLGYSVREITQRHICEIVEAEAAWVVSEFQHLAMHQIWSGRVLLRRLQGSLVKVTVNAFSNVPTNGDAEHVALLHPTTEDGPAIDRLPDTHLQQGLTPGDVSLLQLMVEGFSREQIADILGKEVETVRAETNLVYRKLAASSQTEACVTAMREGVIT